MVIEGGISRALARERASRLSQLRYDVRLSIPPDRRSPISGQVALTFELAELGGPLVVDFAPGSSGTLQTAAINQSAVETTLADGHLVIRADALRRGENTLRCAFTAGDGPLNRRDDHLYTIFVPARAHEALPCFDQPDLKARWSLTLEIPSDWVAVANAEQVEVRDSNDTSRSVVTFAETEPLPTYLFAFAAGRFLENVVERDDREFRVYHCGADGGLVSRNLDAIVDSHAGALRWLEGYTASLYPWGKFDIVLLPAFQFGGMEHPGAIFYNASALLLDPSATRQQLLARAHVIAHETAHMWFGDLVTMTWFDDVWMKEVCANFMAAKIVNPLFPDLDHDLRFLDAHYPAAYDVDRTAGTHAIRQPLENLRDAGSLYGAIIYLKSPVVMRQLERLLGDTGLREALREYLSRFRFGNASWPDLCAILARHTEVDLPKWSHDWIDEAGRPTIETDLAIESGRVSRLALRSRRSSRSHPDREVTWPQAVIVTLGLGGSDQHIAVWLDEEAEVVLAAGLPAPDYVLPNGGGVAYGDCLLEPGSRVWLLRHLPDIASDVTRASAWLALWDTMLAGLIAPAALLDVAMRSLPRERSELNLQRMLADSERLFWVLHTPEERTHVAGRLEAALRDALRGAAAVSTKAAVLASLRSVATTHETVAWMHALWRGTVAIEGMRLGERDYIGLARELAVRLEDGDAVVREQLARSSEGEHREALGFVAPALSRNSRERDRFFATIAQATHRRREPWVIDGMRWLHHPLRAQDSLRYIWPGLELLDEVRRTGDIFLPKRWLDGMLGRHGSPAAATIVRDFLDSRPENWPATLQGMVIASADLLFRGADHDFLTKR